MKKLLMLPTILLLIILIPVVSGLCSYSPNSTGLPVPFLDANPKNSFIITCLDTQSNQISKADIEEYLPGVLAAEMPASFELEALKAQAVAARSYIVSKTLNPSKAHPSAHICNDPNHCKAYISEDTAKSCWEAKNKNLFWDKMCRAVAETKGEYMVYEDSVVEAFFFAGSNGRTENAEDVWGESRPYLKSVESPWDAEEDSLYSTAKVPISEFKAALNISGNSSVPTISHISRTEGNNVDTITIDGVSFDGTEIRKIFGLKSADFDISFSEDTAQFLVKGSGHGVGMSQFGANFMAQKGKNYTEILSHYYTNIQIIKL